MEGGRGECGGGRLARLARRAGARSAARHAARGRAVRRARPATHGASGPLCAARESDRGSLARTHPPLRPNSTTPPYPNPTPHQIPHRAHRRACTTPLRAGTAPSSFKDLRTTRRPRARSVFLTRTTRTTRETYVPPPIPSISPCGGSHTPGTAFTCDPHAHLSSARVRLSLAPPSSFSVVACTTFLCFTRAD